MFDVTQSYLDVLNETQEQHGMTCWSCRAYESEHLWAKFNQKEGIAIKSKVGKLQVCLKDYINYTGAVSYKRPTHSMEQQLKPIDFLFIKDPYYSDEKEYRAVVKLEEEQLIHVDLLFLIDEIVVGPKEEFEDILKIAKEYGLGDRVIKSEVYKMREQVYAETFAYSDTEKGKAVLDQINEIRLNALNL